MTNDAMSDQSASPTPSFAQRIVHAAEGLRKRIVDAAEGLRKRVDRQKRLPPVLLVTGAAVLASGLAKVVSSQSKCSKGTLSAGDVGQLQLTFSAPVFSSLVREALERECPVDSWAVVGLDTVFAFAYALFLSLLVLWLERWRRATPDGTLIVSTASSAQRTLAASALVLAPFAAALADMIPENISLLFAARSVRDSSVAPPALVWIGSLGAAAKWSLLILVGLGCAVSLLSGPRGVVIWRTRYSLLAVLLGAFPLLAIPQGQDILQRLVEGAFPVWRVLFAVLVLTMAAIVTWYCARTLTRVRLVTDAPRADPWFPFFERNLPRMLGVSLLLIAALAFAVAADSVMRFALLTAGSYLGAIALPAERRRALGSWIVGLLSHASYTDALKNDKLLTDRLGRAGIGIIASLLIVWPNIPWPMSKFAMFATPDTREAFYLRAGAGGLLFATWALFLFVYFRRDFAAIRHGNAASLDELRAEEQRKLARGYDVNTLPEPVPSRARAALGVSLIVFILFTYWTVPVARVLGPLGVLAFTAANAVFIGSAAAYLGRKHRIAIVPVALGFAVLVSLWNDNHAIRTLPGTGEPKPTTLARRLDTWIAARERERPAGDTMPIPLILASASGGGLRAAYWTALTLATLQDKEPSFAPHLFAISGVSGGSLGAALFAAMVRDSVPGQSADGCNAALRAAQPSLSAQTATVSSRALVPCVRRFMGDDFLAPTVAKLLSSDLLQWFVPVPIAAWDRATALEASFETSYQATMDAPTFGASFSSLMSVAEAGRVPALLLNTTHVESGRRYITAPFSDTALFLDTRYVHEEIPGSALRVSTAVHNSARFSYVSPAGRIDRQDGVGRGSLVDGGYFENSGLATLNELRREILELLRPRVISAAHPRVHVIVMYLCNDPVSCERELRGDSAGAIRRKTAGEWFAPARALLAAREARGGLARQQLMQAMPKGDFLQFNVCNSLPPRADVADTSAKSSALATTAAVDRTRERIAHPPLGWLLSARAQRWMDASLVPSPGAAARCPDDNAAHIHSIVTRLKPR